MNTVRKALIAAGVKNLKTYGYPDVDATNILADQIYKAFFRSMLEDNKGKSKVADVEIDQLLKETA